MKFLRKRVKQSAKKQSTISFRLNFLLFIVFILFAALIAQLGYLQILYGSKLEAEVQRTDKTVVTSNVPRGMIYDANGRVMVGNKANNAISYTKDADVLSTDIYKTANKLTQYLSVDVGHLTKRDKIDYYLANTKNLKRIYRQIPRSQKVDANGNSVSDKVLYKREMAAIPKSELKFNHQQRQAAQLFKIMSGAYQLSTVYLKNEDVSAEEIAQVSEHLTELPGVNIASDWQRSYPNGDSMRSIFGSVSSEKQGLPDDKLNTYLARGYSRNDRVGTSYLEEQYENVLKGSKAQSQVTMDANNKVISSKKLYQGKKGGNLVLTINSEYQKQVESSLKNVFNSAKSAGMTQYSNGAYAVAMNPKTGAILAMAGLKNSPKKGTTSDDALGVVNQTFTMGSAVKGATVLGGMMSGVITPTNNTLSDAPLYFSGGLIKKAVYPANTYSSLNAVQALEVSSNIYMMRLAMKEGNAKYEANQYFNIDKSVFAKQRGYFHQFGLGVKTGVDLPGEASGYPGPTNDLVKSLDLAYGNFDQYTVMQLGQYVSTIANNGYRMQPYIVKSIRGTTSDGGLGRVQTQSTPKVLNRIGSTQEEINVVKQGFYNVVHGSMSWGTAHDLKDFTPAIAGKTGTAQTFYYDPDNPNNTDPPETLTSSFVGYAPADNPKIAVAVVFPNISTNADSSHYNTQVAEQMFSNYFKDNGQKTSSGSSSKSA